MAKRRTCSTVVYLVGLWALAEYVVWKRFLTFLRTASVSQPGDRIADRKLVSWYLGEVSRKRAPLTISATTLRRAVRADVTWEHYYALVSALLRPNGRDAHARLLRITTALCCNACVPPPPPSALNVIPTCSHDVLCFGTMPLVVTYKPLLIEAMWGGCRLIASASLYSSGFRRKWVPTPEGWIGVWIRRQKRGDHVWPVVFLHGLGMGAAPYISFLSRVLGDRTIILLELPNVSRGNFQTCMPSASNLRQALASVLRQECVCIKRWILMGHSFGTDVCSMLINSSKASDPKPGGVVLLDPVCFAHEFGPQPSGDRGCLLGCCYQLGRPCGTAAVPLHADAGRR